MLIVEWKPITKIERIPPMGTELVEHLKRKNGEVKYSSCSAWNLLYQVLRDNRISIPDVSFSETGKPFFLNCDLYFSVSHSRDICAVAIADCPVGLDVEILRYNYSIHLIERSLNEEERTVYDGDFTRIWCRKEAIGKMTGQGISDFPYMINSLEHDFVEKKLKYLDNFYWLAVTSC